MCLNPIAAILVAVICTVSLAGAATTTAPADSKKPTIQIKMGIAQRMYPHLVRTPSTKPPGLIVYPEYMSVAGTASIYGPASFLRPVEVSLRLAEEDPAKLRDAVYVRIVRLQNDGARVEVEKAAEAMRIVLPKEGRGDDGFDCRFELPFASVNWEPGLHRVEFAVWHSTGEGRNTIGSGPVYFEVRLVEKGSPEEINLLSNALTHDVPGLADRLLADEGYAKTRTGLARRILALDPKDVFARYMLIVQAIQWDGDPAAAVKLWESIEKDVADGTAHRAESIFDPLHTLRPPRPTKEALQARIASELRGVKEAQRRSVAAKERVDAHVREGNVSAVVALITTGEKGIWSVEDVWPVLWAIRALGDGRHKEAHASLVSELRKLPRFPGMFQREIVDALALIHADDKHRNLKDRPWSEGVEIIEWWLARPKLETGVPATAPSSK